VAARGRRGDSPFNRGSREMESGVELEEKRGESSGKRAQLSDVLNVKGESKKNDQ